MSNLVSRRTSLAWLVAGVGGVLGAVSPARAASAKRSIVLDVTPPLGTALRMLGPGLGFFTSGRRPLRGFAEIRRPGREIASLHLALARRWLGVLGAAVVPIDPSATELMGLIGERHLGQVFAGKSAVRLLVVRETEAAAARIEAGGGVRVLFRDQATGALLGVPASPSPPGAVATPAGLDTSFGPLSKVVTARQARQRRFEWTQAKFEVRKPRAGKHFVTLHIARDFGRGVGVVSFLYGSGVIVEPDFGRLLLEAEGGRVGPAAVFDEGARLEIAYEVPVRVRRLYLLDGDARLPLVPVAAEVPVTG